MKKVIFLILIILSFSNFCFAQTPPVNTTNSPQATSKKTVGIFLENPASFAINDTTKELLMRKANRFFPAEKFNVLPLENTDNALKSYTSTNRVSNVYSPQQLDRGDIQAIAKDLNCDYALYITAIKGLPSMSTGSKSPTYKSSVNCDFRMLNVHNGNYVFQKQITEECSSDIVKNGIPSYDNSYSDAFERAVMRVYIDVSKL